MTTAILRTTDGRWVQTADGAARIDTLATTTLKHGDVLELSIATNDGAIDLGTQRTTVRYA